MAVKVSQKYQVVIPQPVREALQLVPGELVDVIVKGKVAFLVRVQEQTQIEHELRGKISHKGIRDKKDRKT